MNLKDLEEVFQDLLNRKQQSAKTIETQASQLENHGNTSGLTSLPNTQHVNFRESSDIRVRTLPNGIPKNPTMQEEFHRGLTYVSENDDRRASFTSQNVPEIVINSRPNSVASSRRVSGGSYTTVSELSDIDDSFTDVTYTPSVSVHSGYAKIKRPAAMTIPSPAMPMTRSHKNALLSIFSHLDQQSLLNCALVCQDWKQISRHPSLWRTVRLANQRISSKFLQTISSWCTEIEWLYLDNLKPRKQRPRETVEDYKRDTRGCLESGLEYLLHKSGSHLISLTIHSCHNILTERCLWLASCYCMNLCSVTYVSQTDPAGHEVIWAVGAGCRQIESLKLPPGFPCDQPYKFNNRCAQMISRCWPRLKALSIGGKGVDGKGLVTIAKNCPKLQVLEINHMIKVSEPVAIAMTKSGLRGLQVLIFRHTPVTTKSILQFNGACSQLRSMSLHLSPSDYFTDADENNEENAARFDQLHKKLQVLAKRPGLRDVLHLYITTPS
ncbi:F-box only protein 41-like isoform X1 [Amphiura filiformis]|uniref:F-box only protein 41-like isoform X1 n=1 Tax=Amphiura filiformis TaxID=82378 RepID=UPI003B219B09